MTESIEDTYNFRHYEKLAKFDTIHDFWKSRKNSTNADEGAANEELLELVQNRILDIALNTDDVSQFLENETNDKVTSATSNYERNIVKYFENNIQYRTHLNADTREQISYQDILDNKADLIQRYSENGDGGCVDVLDISFDETDHYNEISEIINDDKIDEIAGFITQFMYPDINNDENITLTFDGNSRIMGKIFRNCSWASNLIIPQTISDSAPTSFNFLSQNLFMFPETDEGYYKIRSNRLSSGDISMWFENDGFSSDTPFNFTLNIVSNANRFETIRIPFSQNQSQGPSVNYLADLMNEIQTKHNPDLSTIEPSVSSVLKIGEYINDNSVINEIRDNGFFLDLKRTGDHEQALGAKQIEDTHGLYNIFCSIDHLSALFARLIKKPCVFHVNDNITLYRFKVPPQDPYSAYIFSLQNKIKRSILIYEKLKLVKDIRYELGAQINHLDHGIINVIYPESNWTDSRICNVMTYILRLNFIDMRNQLREIWNKANELLSNINSSSSINQIIEGLKDSLIRLKNNPEEVIYDNGTKWTSDIENDLQDDRDFNSFYELLDNISLSQKSIKIIKGSYTNNISEGDNVIYREGIQSQGGKKKRKLLFKKGGKPTRRRSARLRKSKPPPPLTLLDPDDGECATEDDFREYYESENNPWDNVAMEGCGEYDGTCNGDKWSDYWDKYDGDIEECQKDFLQCKEQEQEQEQEQEHEYEQEQEQESYQQPIDLTPRDRFRSDNLSNDIDLPGNINNIGTVTEIINNTTFNVEFGGISHKCNVNELVVLNLGIYKPLYDNENNAFNTRGRYTTLEFSNDIYYNLCKNLSKMIQMLPLSRTRLPRTDLYSNFLKDGFFKDIEYLVHNIQDKNNEGWLNKAIEYIINPSRSFTDPDNEGYFPEINNDPFSDISADRNQLLQQFCNNCEERCRILSQYTEHYYNIRYNMGHYGGERKIKRQNINSPKYTNIVGGSNELVFTLELSALLRKISGMAASYIQSSWDNYDTDRTQSADTFRDFLVALQEEYLNNWNPDYKQPLEILYNDIQYTWESGLYDITSRFSRKKTTADYLLTVLLSYDMYDDTFIPIHPINLFDGTRQNTEYDEYSDSGYNKPWKPDLMNRRDNRQAKTYADECYKQLKIFSSEDCYEFPHKITMLVLLTFIDSILNEDKFYGGNLVNVINLFNLAPSQYNTPNEGRNSWYRLTDRLFTLLVQIREFVCDGQNPTKDSILRNRLVGGKRNTKKNKRHIKHGSIYKKKKK